MPLAARDTCHNGEFDRCCGHQLYLLLVLMAALGSLTACDDQSPPALTLSVFGTRRALTVDETTAGPVMRRARSDDRVALSTLAKDPESGVSKVQILCLLKTLEY